MGRQAPQIGKWYQDAVEDVLFEVVAVDEHSGTVEIQYEDGELGEYDLETWTQLILLSAEPPEDWRAPFELSGDDGMDSDAVMIPDNFGDPLAALEDDFWLDVDDLP